MVNNKVKLFVFFLLPLLIAEAKKPNILFIFADDQCYETIRELKITDIDTPHLDRLMKAGTVSLGHTIWVPGVELYAWQADICSTRVDLFGTRK